MATFILTPELLICRQLKAGRLPLADDTWLKVKDTCEAAGLHDDYLIGKGDVTRDLRHAMWRAAAGAVNAKDSLNWLVEKSQRFMPSPEAALRHLHLILGGRDEVKNLDAASWLVDHVNFPEDRIQDVLPSLVDQATQLSDARGLDWILRQNWNSQPLVQSTRQPLLLRVITQHLAIKQTHIFTDSLFTQMQCLLGHGVKPLVCTGAPMGLTGCTSPLSVLASFYRQRAEDLGQQALSVDAKNEKAIAHLWTALVDAGDDPARVEAVSGQSPRQCITGTPLEPTILAIERSRKAPLATTERSGRRLRS